MTDTSTETRTPGRRGRRAPSHQPELMLHLFRGSVDETSVPATGDVTAGVTSWGMLGNDEHSDCGAAMVEHARIAKAATGAGDGSGTFPADFVAPTLEGTLEPYYAYGIEVLGEPGPTPDGGVENASWLRYLYDVTAGMAKKPGSDDVIEWAYAEVDVSNLAELRQAMLDFRGVLIGCTLTDEAEDEFSKGEPWTITPTEQPDPQLGHDILLVKYDEAGETFVTWGALQAALVDWESGEVGAGDLEAWVIITAEDVERGAIAPDQFAALKQTISELGGTLNPNTPDPAAPPAPDPAPPEPTPVPGPDEVDGFELEVRCGGGQGSTTIPVDFSIITRLSVRAPGHPLRRPCVVAAPTVDEPGATSIMVTRAHFLRSVIVTVHYDDADGSASAGSELEGAEGENAGADELEAS